MLYCLRSDFKEKICICSVETQSVLVFCFGFLSVFDPRLVGSGWGPVEAKFWLSHSRVQLFFDFFFYAVC